MLVCAAVETPRVYDVDGLDVFGSELANSGLGYFLINRAGTDDEGAHHYVEIFDQKFGRFDGLRKLALSADGRRIALQVTFDVNGLGSDFCFECAQDIDPASLEWVQSLAAEIDLRA